MAKIKLSSYLASVSGKIGNIVYFNKYGREYARVHVYPANPRTCAQRAVRNTFGDAVKSWQALAEEEKNEYNRRARMLPMSGYNLYISRYMRQNLPPAAQTGKNIYVPQSTQKAYPSVPPPFIIKERVYSAIIHSSFR